MMCPACRHPGRHLADADPATIIAEYGESIRLLAGEQRANLEKAKERRRPFCGPHLLNYERVVEALEEE
jgi:hypothetical protein